MTEYKENEMGTVREDGLSFEKVWLLFQETDKKFKETEKLIQENARRIGDPGNKWGRFVEGVVEPSMVRLFNERGIPIKDTSQRMKGRKIGETLEVDFVGFNGIASPGIRRLRGQAMDPATWIFQ